MTTSLAEIQALFSQGLNPFSHPDDQIQASFLIKDKGPLTTLQKLQVYQRNVSGAHIAVLEQIFPICREMLGENPFATYAREYCWNHPEVNPDLNCYGVSFPEVLSQQAKLTEVVPYVSDLAKLEYHWHQAWFSPDAGTFNFEKLAEVQDQTHRLVFQCPEHLSLIQSPWPIHHLWEEHRNGTPPEELAINDEPDRLLIIRRDTRVDVEDLSVEAFELISAIQQNHTLEQLSSSPELSGALSLLPHFIENSWICGFQLLPKHGHQA